MKKKYLLDTCILSALKKPTADGHIQAVTRLNSLDDDDEVCISILSIYELEAGASHTLNLDLESKTRKAIASIRNRFKILPIPMEAGDEKIYGALRELFKEWELPDLKKYRLGDKALQKYSVDLMIVTTAMREEAILVTNDTMAAVVPEICSKFQWQDWLT